MLVACREPPGGQKCDIHLTLQSRDCNTTAEPPICTSHLYAYVTITKPCSALLCSAIILLLEAYTYPLSMFCAIPLDLGYKATATVYMAEGKQPDNI